MATFAPLPHRFRTQAAASANSVLLETARPTDRSHHSYLFEHPQEIIAEYALSEVVEALDKAEQASRDGKFLAGYLTYEAGFAFERSLSGLLPSEAFAKPLVWLGVYNSVETFDHLHPQGQDEENASYTPPPTTVALSLSQVDYERRVRSIQQWIEQGDTYQANLTLEAQWDEAADAASLLQRFMQTQPVEFGALLNLGGTQIISASPELFYERRGREITTRPMKGTSPRGRWTDEDDTRAEWLRNDPKNRAENLMIVDLLRNDLGRICEHGSIQASNLFAIERFPTVLQMTSTVQGTLRHSVGFPEIIRALFPSGSIVGAPKIRTMQILRALELRDRGVYTGAIGFLKPGGDSTFSVAIRTVELQQHQATMGVGSGIVYDSDPTSEFEECKVKASFVTRTPETFSLIETIRWDRGYTFLDEHIARLMASAAYFHFACDEVTIRTALEDVTRDFACGSVQRVRLLLARNGEVTVTSSPLTVTSTEEPIKIIVAQDTVRSDDRMLFHKTTHRAQYDAGHQRALSLHCADAIFLNERGEVTEGAIHNLVVVRDGSWFTPPVESGLLRGVYRDHLLRSRPKLREGVLRFDDLLNADEVYLCNSVRGLRKVGRILQETSTSPRLIWSKSIR